MGAAIAYVCAKAGIEVVLKDVLTAAERAGFSAAWLIKPSARPLYRRLPRSLLAPDPAHRRAGRPGRLDLVIEAVFEDPALKHRVFAEVQHLLAGDALLRPNTSTLPITLLAKGVKRREQDFIGLHFFSPVGQDAAG